MSNRVIHPKCDIPLLHKTSSVLWSSIMVCHRYDKDSGNYVPLSKEWEVFGVNSYYTVDNERFTVRSYCWQDVEDIEGVEPQKYSLDWHKNDWHFYHKPSGLKIQWYKYPLRDAYTNMEITDEELCDVLYDCSNFLTPNFITECNKWWEKDNSQNIEIKNVHSYTVFNDFEIGHEYWTYSKYRVKIICPFCNGSKKIKVNGLDIKCNNCDYKGELETLNEVVLPQKIKIKSIKASITKNHIEVKYNVCPVGDNSTGNIRHRNQNMIFNTEEECKAFIGENFNQEN